jgi:hypothetical protein
MCLPLLPLHLALAKAAATADEKRDQTLQNPEMRLHSHRDSTDANARNGLAWAERW